MTQPHRDSEDNSERHRGTEDHRDKERDTGRERGRRGEKERGGREGEIKRLIERET